MSPISDKGHNYTLHTNLISGMQIQVPSLNMKCTLIQQGHYVCFSCKLWAIWC